MQVSSASSPAQELLISTAKAAGRSEKVVSKEVFGTTRQADRFEKTLAIKENAGTYSPEATQKSLLNAQLSSSNAADAPKSETGAETGGDFIQFTQADIDSLLKLFGSTNADADFNEQFDLDGNGTINLQDLNAMLAQISQVQPQGLEEPEPSFTQEDLDLLLESFGAQAGDENYSDALDLDGDGIIGLQDLNAMLANLSAQPQPATYTQSHIDQLTAAFGASTGDENFVAQLDLNEDGTLNLADLNAMLASINS